jgi:hypothetical protein
VKEILLWVILPLVLAEAILIGPWLSERLLRWGARGLPEQYRERYAEDWLGELDAVPGSLTKLAFAVRVLVRVPATERALTGRDALWLMAAKRMIALLVAGSLLALQYLFRLSGRLSRNSITEAWLRWRAARSLTSTRQQKVRKQFVAEVEAAAATYTNFTHSRALRTSTPLDEIMNPRTAQILHRANIHTFGQLITKYEHEGELGLLNIRDFGHRELEEARLLVQRALNERYRGTGYRPPPRL